MANRFEGQIEWLVDDEYLWRQVHPSFLKGGQMSSEAFNASEAHEYTLSTARQWLGAEAAYRQHVEQHLDSAGTWAVRVNECRNLDLYPFDDSRLPNRPTAHVSIQLPEGQSNKGVRKKKAQALRDYAIAHGCQYQPPVGANL